MKRFPYRKIFSRLLAFLFFCNLLCFHDVRCGTLQCEERHVANKLDLDGLFNVETCARESEGQNLTSSDCTVWDFSTGKYDYNDCRNLSFPSGSEGLLSNFQVLPYNRDGYPNLNITFRNINWHYMQYRQQVEDHKSCQKLELHPSVRIHQELQLSFACSEWGQDFMGQDAELQLAVGESPSHITANAHLLLKVPEPSRMDKSKANITNWMILVVVDVAHKPNLLVHWPAVPKKFGVTKYNVRLGDSNPKVVELSSCPDDYCSLPLFAGYESRKVRVSVQPVHDLCVAASCRSFTPDIMLEFSFPFYFILLIAVAFVLFLLFIVCSVYYFCCACPREPPSLLILYDATERQHCRVVRILTEYLWNVAKIHCWLADSEVPLTESQDSSKWLRKALEEADAVLVIASPATHLEIRYSVYPNVLYEALHLIANLREHPTENESQGRYLVAIPPYCSEEDIPMSLEDLPRIVLPQQLSFLVWSVYNQRLWWPWLACVVKVYLLSCWCPGPTSAYRKHGGRLAEALRCASATKMIEEQAPPTPKSSRYTTWTLRNTQDETDRMSMPYKEFPGNLNSFPLLGGSISEENVAPKAVVDIDNLSLG